MMNTPDKLIAGGFLSPNDSNYLAANEHIYRISQYLSMGEAQRFVIFVRSGKQRVGQAFFNALTDESQKKLRGTVYDTFHTDNTDKIMAALDYLTRT